MQGCGDAGRQGNSFYFGCRDAEMRGGRVTAFTSDAGMQRGGDVG